MVNISINDEYNFISDANTTLTFYLVVAGGLLGFLLICFAAVILVCKKIKRDQLLSHPPPIMHNESNYEEIGVGPVFLYSMTFHSQSNLDDKKDKVKQFNSSTMDSYSTSKSSMFSQKTENLEHTDALSAPI